MNALSVPDPRDAWTLAAILSGLPVEPSSVQSEGWRRVATGPHSLVYKERDRAWEMLACMFGDAVAVNRAVWQSDPDSPPPPETPATASQPFGETATLASIERQMTGEEWLWEGYLPAARLSGIAAFEGCGKTRFAVDLARRLWHGLSWPDGQPATLPRETPTLWICSDGQHEELAIMADEFKLPPHALFFNTDDANPYDGTTIDEPDDLDRLEAFINALHPGLVFIDSLTNATHLNMCSAQETQLLMTPLAQLAQRTRTTIVPLLHLSKEGQALGRRIKGLTRTLIHLESLDHNAGSRLRLWVEKSYAKKPPALKVTMTDTGNLYEVMASADLPVIGKIPRPSLTREAAEEFLLESLRICNAQGLATLLKEWERKEGARSTFYRAVDALAATGDVLKQGGPGPGRPVYLHLPKEEETF
jgi:AAA domain